MKLFLTIFVKSSLTIAGQLYKVLKAFKLSPFPFEISSINTSLLYTMNLTFSFSSTFTQSQNNPPEVELLEAVDSNKPPFEAAAPPAAAPVVNSVPDYTHLTPGGQYVTGHAGETVYLSPDGSAWTMQADSSFIRTS